MFKISAIFSILLLLCSLISPAQNIWNLDQCIRYAKDNNLVIRQSELNTRMQEALLKQSRTDLLLDLGVDASTNYLFGRSIDPTTYTFFTANIQTFSVGMSSRVTLFSGFRKLNTIRQNSLDLEASQYASEATVEDITLQIIQAYLQIRLFEEQLRSSEKLLVNTQSQLVVTRRLVEAGRL